MLILPDTSCWIEYFRPQGDVAVREPMLGWVGADCLAVCGAIRAEVLRGARRDEADSIRDAFDGLTHLATLDDDWRTVEEKARALAEEGRAVPLLDLLVAVVASRAGAVLAHKDAHFDTIAREVPLRLHSFLPG